MITSMIGALDVWLLFYITYPGIEIMMVWFLCLMAYQPL